MSFDEDLFQQVVHNVFAEQHGIFECENWSVIFRAKVNEWQESRIVSLGNGVLHEASLDKLRRWFFSVRFGGVSPEVEEGETKELQKLRNL